MNIKNFKCLLRIWGILLFPSFISILVIAFLLNSKLSKTKNFYFEFPHSYIQLNALVHEYTIVEKERAKLKKQNSKGKKVRIFYNPFEEKTKIETSSKSIDTFNEILTERITLKFIFQSLEPFKKVCLINNKFYHEGDYIKKGVKISKIGDHYVEIRIHKKLVRLKVGDSYSF